MSVYSVRPQITLCFPVRFRLANLQFVSVHNAKLNCSLPSSVLFHLIRCGERRVRKWPASPRTRRKSACCFFALTSITIGTCVTMRAHWVVSALGVVWVCIACVYTWKWLCSFWSGWRRTVGGGQGALVLVEIFPWVMPVHVGGFAGMKEEAMKGEEIAKQCQTWGTKPISLPGAAATQAASCTHSPPAWTISLTGNRARTSAPFPPREGKSFKNYDKTCIQIKSSVRRDESE